MNLRVEIVKNGFWVVIPLVKNTKNLSKTAKNFQERKSVTMNHYIPASIRKTRQMRNAERRTPKIEKNGGDWF